MESEVVQADQNGTTRFGRRMAVRLYHLGNDEPDSLTEFEYPFRNTLIAQAPIIP